MDEAHACPGFIRLSNDGSARAARFPTANNAQDSQFPLRSSRARMAQAQDCSGIRTSHRGSNLTEDGRPQTEKNHRSSVIGHRSRASPFSTIKSICSCARDQHLLKRFNNTPRSLVAVKRRPRGRSCRGKRIRVQLLKRMCAPTFANSANSKFPSRKWASNIGKRFAARTNFPNSGGPTSMTSSRPRATTVTRFTSGIFRI